MVLFVSVSILLYVLICFPGLIPNAQLMTPPPTQVHHNQNNGRFYSMPMSIVIDLLEDQGQHPLPVIETRPMGINGKNVPELYFLAVQSYFFMQAISNHFQMLLSKEMMYGPYLEVSEFRGCVTFQSDIFVTGNLAELPRRWRQRRLNNLFLAACRPYRDPPHRHDLGRMDVAVPVAALFIGGLRNSRTARNKIRNLEPVAWVAKYDSPLFNPLLNLFDDC